MNYRQFQKQFEPLIPSPTEGTTRKWMGLARDLTTASETPLADYLNELLRAFVFIGRNFPPDVVQELYLTREDCEALLNNELFWGAMFLQAGGTRQQTGEQASKGAFEVGMLLPDLSTQTDVLSCLSLFTLYTGKQKSYYLTDQSPEHPELLVNAVQQGAPVLGISYMEAFARLKRDLTFLPTPRDNAYSPDMVFYKVEKEAAKLVGDNFLNGTAVAALVNFDANSGTYTTHENKRWQLAAQERSGVAGISQPQL